MASSPTIIAVQGSHGYPSTFPSPSPSPSALLRSQEAALPAMFRDSVNLSPCSGKESEITESQDYSMAFGPSTPATPRVKIFPMVDATSSTRLFNQPSGEEQSLTPTNDQTAARSQEVTASVVTDKMLVGITRNIDVLTPQGDPNNSASSSLSPGRRSRQNKQRSQSPTRRSPRLRRSVSPFVVNSGSSTPVPEGNYPPLDIPSAMRIQKKKLRTRAIPPASTSNLGSENGSRSGSVAVGGGWSGNDVTPDLRQQPANLQEQDSPKKRGKRRIENDIECEGAASEQRQLGPVTPSQPIPSAHRSQSQSGIGTDDVFSFLTPHPENVFAQAQPRSRRANRNGSPVRFTSPTAQQSPVTIQPMDLDDPNRSPARRIPLEQAVAQGQISVQKAMQLASRPPDHLSGSQALFPQRTVVFPFRSEMQSPARRIPVSEATPVKSHGPLSPIRAPLNARSKSVEPKPVQSTATRPARSASVDYQHPPTLTTRNDSLRTKPQTFPPVSKSAPRLPLPYPLVPPREPSIPEETEPLLSSPDAHIKSIPVVLTSTTPTKSHLRQSPSTSRIPRMTMKPYTKPALVAAATTSSKAKEGKASGIMRRVDLALGANAVKTVGPIVLASFYYADGGISIWDRSDPHLYQKKAVPAVPPPHNLRWYHLGGNWLSQHLLSRGSGERMSSHHLRKDAQVV